MLGDFITRILVIVFGYAYPAFECYKTVEKNRVEIEELRFWCQYWIIVAVVTIIERFADVFVSWLPLYGEMKLAFIIYLWYPKTKGTTYVYETFLQPHIAEYETDIDQKLLDFRTRVWDLAVFYWKNCAYYGQSTFFQFLQYLAAQSAKARDTTTQETNGSFNRQMMQPSSPTSKVKFSKINQVHEYQITEDADNSHDDQDQTNAQESDMTETLRAARIRLRRSQPQ